MELTSETPGTFWNWPSPVAHFQMSILLQGARACGDIRVCIHSLSLTPWRAHFLLKILKRFRATSPIKSRASGILRKLMEVRLVLP